MNGEIYTYAFITALRNSGFDYIDIFGAFVVNSIPDDIFVNINEIQKNLNVNLALCSEVPVDVLRTILMRTKKSGFVELGQTQKQDPETKEWIQERLYKLTPKGINYAREVSETEKVKKRTQELCDDIVLYFRNKKTVITTRREIYKVVTSFARKNINTLNQLISKQYVINLMIPTAHKHERYLIEYVKFIKDRNSKHYKTLREILYGSVISVILYAKNRDEMAKKKMRPCKVYLDTNFIFSLLGMHSKEEFKAAKGLFNLLKKSRFGVYVFDFTISEMRRVIGGYIGYLKKPKFWPHGGSIYKRLECKGWDNLKASEFISDVEKILTDKGIKIEVIPEDKFDMYRKADEHARFVLKQKKSKHPTGAIEHDLAAMEIIKRKRGKKIWEIENSEGFFLTSDRILSKINYEEMRHKQDGTICEILLDRFLVNVLWLKDPRLDFPLETIIAANSRDHFVDQSVWETFYKKLESLYIENKISEDSIIKLFYDDYIVDILSEADDKEISTLTENSKLNDIIKGAEENFNERLEQERKIGEKKTHEWQEKTHEAIAQIEQKNKEMGLLKIIYLAELEKQKEKLRNEIIEPLSRKHAKQYSVLILFIVNTLLLFIFTVTFSILRVPLLSILIVLLLIFLNILRLFNSWPWGIIQKTMYNRIYQRNVRTIDNG